MSDRRCALRAGASQSVAIGLLALALGLACGRRALAADDFEFVRTFVRKHCVECHGGPNPEGKIFLDRMRNAEAVKERTGMWLKVQQVLSSGKMPPEDEPRPDKAEVERVLKWINDDVLKLNCNGERDPGRVTIRRLNRGEYNNTIRDLIGVDFRPGDDFPVDDSGYGFDNIGDVLTMSPLLFEKYLAAAEKITTQALVTDPKRLGVSTRIAAKEFKRGPGTSVLLGKVIFTTEATIDATHEFARDGEYSFRIRAFGHQGGDELPQMSLRVDNEERHVFTVKAEIRQPEIHAVTLKVPRGKHNIAIAFTNDFYDPQAKDPQRTDRNLIVEYLDIQAPPETTTPAIPATHRRIITATPATSERSSLECAREVLKKFATRAFRRPVSGPEVDRLARLVSQAEERGEPFERGIEIALQAVLVSPSFLFRVEADQFPSDPKKPHPITEFELATRLSYFLWSSMPDDELFAQAEKGTLRQNLDAQVKRMLADRKSQALVENFSGQWLETRKLVTVQPDPQQFPGFNDKLRHDMRQETELFFGAVMRDDRSVLDFLDARYTFVNERLAKHYGLGNVRGEEFRRVELADGRRGGVLTQASVLTVTSNPTRTSPVKRGKWVMEQILGTPPPPPPPNVPELEQSTKAAESLPLRKRMELHRTNAVCASCHLPMDALGFGLENFDAIGQWRDKDAGQPIDATGKLPSGQPFKDPGELRQALKSSMRDAFVRCLAEKLLTYATGRGVEYYDKCALDDITARMTKADHKFSELVLGIVHSDPFQKRRAKR